MSSEASFVGDGRLPGDASPVGWFDHELWRRAGAGAGSVAATPERPARLRRRRDIGRSLYRTFDSARRRCGRGAAISLGGL